MPNNRFLSLLGMARKANRLSLGYDKALESIHKNKAKTVFLANDLSEKTKKGLVLAALETDISIITVNYSIFDLTSALGTKTGIVAVNDEGFANKLNLLIK